MRPKKSLGQNFLVDAHCRQRIVEALHLAGSDIVLEIGPGRGEMTSMIAGQVGRYAAVEFDRTLIPGVRELLKPWSHAQVIEGDILRVDLARILAEVIGTAPAKVKVFGNIPYYISTPILEVLIRHRACISEAFVTVQKEFCQRVVAVPGSKVYGSLSCFVQYYAVPRMLFTISRNSFWPVPKVDSALLHLAFRDSKELLSAAEEERLFRLIRTAFQYRRKTLRNCLKGVVEEGAVAAFLKRKNLPAGTRPERLSLQDFTELSRQ